jgi:tetratricopeptide (TPR) repeat protein
MKTILILMLAALPASAADAVPAQPAEQAELAVPMELDSSSFNDDAESISAKIRRMIGESRKEKLVREMNSAQKDPAAAQKALDIIAKEDPEMKKEQPHVFEYYQGSIDFFQRDFDKAYDNFDNAIKTFHEKYPGGIPQGKYYEHNAAFVADLYMGRGTTAMFLKQDAEAVKDINRAILTSPKPRAYMQVNKSRALIRLKKYKEASEAYDRAYEVDPKWTASSSDRATVCAILAKKGFQPQACQVKN